jgi:hypothetical protein
MPRARRKKFRALIVQNISVWSTGLSRMREFSTDSRLCGRAPALGRFAPMRFLVMPFRRSDRRESSESHSKKRLKRVRSATFCGAARGEGRLPPKIIGALKTPSSILRWRVAPDRSTRRQRRRRTSGTHSRRLRWRY